MGMTVHGEKAVPLDERKNLDVVLWVVDRMV